MKAIVYTEYGPPNVLKLKEVEKPHPKGDEVLIKIQAVSVNYGDIAARNFGNISPSAFHMPFLFWILARFSFGFNKPKIEILGNSFAGEVEAIGDQVKQFKKGEKVFGYVGEKMGAYAEYLCMSENGILARKPANVVFEEAACIPYGALMALNLLRKVNILKGQKVLIIGASGGIGSAAVQLAKYFWEAEVTGVCSTPSIAFVKSLGANKVIDYKKEDFSTNGVQYDLLFDILGKGSFASYKSSLKQNGVYFSVSFKAWKLLQMLWTSMIGKKKVVCALATPQKEDLKLIKELVESGKIKPIIDKIFPLEKTADAHQYIEAGKKKGNVVITNGQ